MKFDLNKPLKTLEVLSTITQVSTDIRLPVILTHCHYFRRIKLKHNINDITFEKFILAAKHYGKLSNASQFIGAINGIDYKHIEVLKIKSILGLYNHYTKDFTKILNLFKEQQELIEKTTQAKYDMQEFGLTCIPEFLSLGVKSELQKLMKETVSFIFVEYRREIKKIENINHQIKLQNVRNTK